jgi:hypothetical protein
LEWYSRRFPSSVSAARGPSALLGLDAAVHAIAGLLRIGAPGGPQPSSNFASSPTSTESPPPPRRPHVACSINSAEAGPVMQSCGFASGGQRQSRISKLSEQRRRPLLLAPPRRGGKSAGSRSWSGPEPTAAGQHRGSNTRRRQEMRVLGSVLVRAVRRASPPPAAADLRVCGD